MEVEDQAEPYLWPDELVRHYIEDAQQWFCRLTQGIEDARTNEVCRIDIVPFQQWYDISPLILKIRSATLRMSGCDIEVLSHEKFRRQGLVFDGFLGRVQKLVSGESKATLRAWPMPDRADIIDLAVFRLPLDPVVAALGQELEIDEQHHAALLMHMKYRAYSVAGSETFNANKAAEYDAMFKAYCVKANQEQDRMRRPAGTTSYGGI